MLEHQLFIGLNAIASFAWLTLILFPRQINVPKGVFVTVTLLCLTYFILTMRWAGAGFNNGGGFGTLDQVMTLFKSDKAVLVGWIHYLAFDLFIGLWMTTDAHKIALPRWKLIISQLLTFLLGPIGLFLYTRFRAAHTGQQIILFD